MLPAHGYPELKKHPQLFYGHYGTAWHNRRQEFKKFPGAILITTNCIQEPKDTYRYKNILLGPSLPAFITPNVLNVLVEKFGIEPITTLDENIAAILGKVGVAVSR